MRDKTHYLISQISGIAIIVTEISKFRMDSLRKVGLYLKKILHAPISVGDHNVHRTYYNHIYVVTYVKSEVSIHTKITLHVLTNITKSVAIEL